MGGTKPDESEESEQEEREQGKRLLIANFLMLILGITSVLLVIGAWTFCIKLLFGSDAISWSGRPPIFDKYPSLPFLLAVTGAVSIWLTYLLWKFIFYRSGYISHFTQQQFAKGIWPMVGGYWKPFGYAIYICMLSYGAYLGYVQEGLWALLLTLAFVFWLVYLAWIDLRNFKKNRPK